MEELKVFYLDDTPTMPNMKVLRVNHELFHCTGTSGSYQLLPARLLNISWAEFLRLCRDEYGAELYGKNSLYPVPYFPINQVSHLLVKMLNKLAYMVEWERTHKEVLEWAEQEKINEEAKQVIRTEENSGN